MPSLWSPEIYQQAALVTAGAHQGQTITDSPAPYLLHVILVAAEVTAALQVEAGLDGDLAVACALLHDTLEDTAVQYADLRRDFGERVAAGVQALTKNAALPKNQQLADSLRRIQQQPREIALVKLADRVVNLRPAPASWTCDKVAAYRQEAQLILATLGWASPSLAGRLTQRLTGYGRELA
ncbi:MAG: bifunctional (p)ppGpp synthetase/guanosine-3',5'-bis(diphosphate) 3'-pyrophosphohydrolase [Anaerolineales bacterium]|nr:bifunctional (p)ppGpp synthetase/guanosine-3',5'-bis(diphosphate) 3'-pyrophosphohydrolase [Anaerolineales bacterium]